MALRLAAAKVQQGNLTLFATSIPARQLLSPNFYSVETLDPENPHDKGYQRLLNKARANQLAAYLLKGQENGDAFIPTSVFLATDRELPFSSTKNILDIDPEKIGPFSVVDGQHRLEGLRIAAEKNKDLLNFEMPVNIAANLPMISQMAHFLIVNTTQKSVDKSVEQRIYSRLTEAIDVEDLPSLPKWVLNIVQKGEVERAIKLADYLNDTPESPWRNKIQMANSDKDNAAINQKTFVKSIVKYVLTANNPISALKDFDKEKKIFMNYWRAIANILDTGADTVVYKYNGVELFCRFSIPFFMKLQEKGNFTVPAMEDLLRNAFENVEGEYAGVGHPDWWMKGGKAGMLNSAAINVIWQEMNKALHKTNMSHSITI